MFRGPPELVGLGTDLHCLPGESWGSRVPAAPRLGGAAGRRLTVSSVSGARSGPQSYTQAGRCCHLVDRSGMLRPRIGSEDLAPSGGLVLSA